MKWRLIIDSLESPTGLTLSVLGMDITRDDLIRLVVGMQWREAVMTAKHYCYSERGGWWSIREEAESDLEGLLPASTIVDEWLGVQK